MTDRQSTNNWLKEITEMFPIPSYEEWEGVAKASLKGKAFEKLFTSTYEEITLQPVYRRDNVNKVLPQHHDMNHKSWMIAQEINATNVKDVISTIKKVLKLGQNCVNLNLDPLDLDDCSFNALVESFDDASFFLKSSNKKVASLLVAYEQSHNKKLSGIIGHDPIGNLVAEGTLHKKLSSYYDEWADFIKVVNQSTSSIRTLLVESQPVHNGGANVVQELAYTFSVAIEYIRRLQERGLSIEEIAPHFAFSFSIGSNMFMEISKLRAAKFLWASIVKEFGGSTGSQKMWIHARTSHTTKTKYDPYVNMLRATVETFAAVVGGANSIHTSTFDEAFETSSVFSERIARNVQSILKDEAHLSRVVDPGGGSWYIENLTHQLAEKVWNEIQSIEQDGGIIAVLKNGTFQESVKRTREFHFEEVDVRKERIVGTNMYANVKEKPLAVNKNNNDHKPVDDFKGDALSEESILPIPSIRWSMKFEELRENVESLNTAVQLINLGEMAKHKPRTDFIKGFFEVGGFEVKDSESFKSLEDIKLFLSDKNEKVYIICGQDESYAELAKEIVEMIKVHSNSSFIYIAGKLEATIQQVLVSSGLTDMIHMNTNCYSFLNTLLVKLEGYYEKA